MPRQHPLRIGLPQPSHLDQRLDLFAGQKRVNARLKLFWGADDGNVKGSRRFVAQVGVVMAVHAAFATLLAMAPRREGTLCRTKLSPVAKALHEAASVPAE